MVHHWSPDTWTSAAPEVGMVTFYLTPGFELLALSSALEVLKLVRRDVFRWRTVSHTGEAVNASCGISVATNGDLAQERRYQSHPETGNFSGVRRR